MATGHLHGPTSICGAAVTYDANGNMTGYDPDGASGPLPAKTIAYDGENRPTSVTQNGTTPSFLYAPDGAWAAKYSGFGSTAQNDYYLSADTEVLVPALFVIAQHPWFSSSTQELRRGCDRLSRDPSFKLKHQPANREETAGNAWPCWGGIECRKFNSLVGRAPAR